MAISNQQQHPEQPSKMMSKDNNNHHDNDDDDITMTRKRSLRKNRSGSFSDSSTTSSDHSTSFSSSSSISSCSSSSSSTSPPPLLTSTTPRNKPSRRRCRGRGGNKNKAKKTEQQQLIIETLSLEEQAQYVALDCEMVGVGLYGQASAVARVTLVGWNGEVIMDELIKQEQPVTDYRTFVSGITENDLFGENANVMDLTLCQALVCAHLEGKILVGHALKNDLQALGVRHPWQMTRDTAKYEPFMQVRFDDGVLWPRKLRDLVHEKLNNTMADFQQPGQAHSSYDDALAALELYKVARNKWEKVMAYKISKTREIQQAAAAVIVKPAVVAIAAVNHNHKAFAAVVAAAC